MNIIVVLNTMEIPGNIIESGCRVSFMIHKQTACINYLHFGAVICR